MICCAHEEEEEEAEEDATDTIARGLCAVDYLITRILMQLDM